MEAYFTFPQLSNNIGDSKKGNQNDAETDAKIIKDRFWAAKGATTVRNKMHVCMSVQILVHSIGYSHSRIACH